MGSSTIETQSEESVTVNKIKDNNNLTSFFRKYNSEDNESFEKIHSKDIEDRKRKYHWAYDDDALDENGERRQAGMLMWYHAGGKLLTQDERKNIDQLLSSEDHIDEVTGKECLLDRPSQVNTWKFRVRNQLMFPPDLQTSRDISTLPSTSTSTIGNQAQNKDRIRPATDNSIQNDGPLMIKNKNCENNSQSNMTERSKGALAIRPGDKKVINKFKVERGCITAIESSKCLPKDRGAHSTTIIPAQGESSIPSLTVLDTNTSYSTYFAHLDTDQQIVHRNTRLKGSFLQDREMRDRALHDKFTPLHAHRMSTPSSVLSAPLEEPHAPSVATNSNAGDDGDWESSGTGANYRPVSMTPSPEPATVYTNSSDDPLLTWGVIAGTPMILDPKLSDLVDDLNDRKKRKLADSDRFDARNDKRRNRYNYQQADDNVPLPSLDINASTFSDSFTLNAPSRREQLLHAIVPSAGKTSKGEKFLLSSSSKVGRRNAHRSSYPPASGKPSRKALTPAAQALAMKILPSSATVAEKNYSHEFAERRDGKGTSMVMSLRQSYNTPKFHGNVERKGVGVKNSSKNAILSSKRHNSARIIPSSHPKSKGSTVPRSDASNSRNSSGVSSTDDLLKFD